VIINGLKSARHPGRLEMLDGNPPVLLDGAHNPAAAQALRDYLEEFVPQPVTIVFGAMRDKPLSELAEILFPAADQIVLTQMDNPRSATIAELKAVVPTTIAATKVHEAGSVEEAVTFARAVTEAASLILVTGSLYLVGAVRARLIADGATSP
jgi:dihydrofolate synthase/folylpolyglutamate synthase